MRRVTKEEAEWAIFNRFSPAYETQYGAALTEPAYRDKPDFSAIDAETGRTIGIEVTGVYQDAREAEINYLIDYEWGSLTGSFDSLVANVNLSLASKSTKAQKYEWSQPLALAIWLGSFLFRFVGDAKLLVPALTVPANRFSLIALVVEDEASHAPRLHVLQELRNWRIS